MAASHDVYQIVHADDFAAALKVLATEPVDCALLDVSMLAANLESALLRIISHSPGTSIVLICDGAQQDLAMLGVRHGAHDFVVRDTHHPDSLVRTVRSSLERHTSKTNLHFLAHHDTLTGLANRVLFHRTLEASFEAATEGEGSPFGVLFIDLDGFKPVNDTLGHDAGDELLRIIARRLRRNVSHDDLVGRLGGDEFAVLVSNLKEPANAVSVARRLLREIEQPMQIEGEPVNVSCSIGVATSPSFSSAQGIIKAADEAMYDAKRAGGNGLHVHADTAVGGLYEVFRRNELELFYQPQVDLGGQLVGVEALLRWNRDGEIVLPNQFVPELEDSGLIVSVGEWVIDRALEQLVRWRADGVDVPRVAVNVSPVQLQRVDLVATLDRLLGEHKLPPSSLELEVTERVMLADHGRTRENLEGIRAMGVSIALDDFGTGYSSLSSLHDYPVNTIKVDRRFVRDIASNARSASIVGSILDLGRRLGLEVVAEGVETLQQVELLQKEGCKVLQGFLFGHPEPATELGSTMTAESPVAM